MQEEHPLFRKKAIEKLQAPEQLDQLMTITSPRGWVMLSSLIIFIASALIWSIFATIQTTVPGRGVLAPAETDPTQLGAVLFVTPEEGRFIHSGMIVRVSPITAPQEVYGLMWGIVRTVNQRPANQARMLAVLQNDALQQDFAADGLLVEVQVDFIPDETTPSGYQWTSTDGPPNKLQPYTLATGSVLIKQQHPIELIFPSFFED